MKAKYSWAVIVAVCFGVYANSLENGFHYDDIHSVVDNLHIRDLDNVPAFFTEPGMFSRDADKGMYRPLLLLTYALNYAIGDALIDEGSAQSLGGFDVTGYHLVNILIHALNSCLLAWLTSLLTGRGGVAVTAGLLFAIHPLGTEPVNYISSRSESLAAFFYLLSMCLFAAGGRSRKGWQVIASQVVLGLGLFSKSIVITLLAVLPILDYLLLCSGSWARFKPGILKRHALGWVLAAFYLSVITRNGFLPHSLSTPVRDQWQQFLTQAEAIGYYAHTLIMPVHLSVEPQFSVQNQLLAWHVLAPLLVVFSLAFVFVRRCFIRRFDLGFFLSSWGVLSLLPVIVLPLNVFVNERRLYLPCAAFCIGLALLIHGQVRGPAGLLTRLRIGRINLTAVGIGVLCVAFAVHSISRNRVWADDFSLWSDAVEKSPLMPRAHLYLGNAHKDAALQTLDRALEIAHWKKADEAYEAVIELQRDQELTLRALNNRGSIRFELEKHEAAEPFFRRAVEIRPTYADAIVNLGNVYLMRYRRSRSAAARMENLDEAIQHYEKALKLRPNHFQAHSNLGLAYRDLGQYEKALRSYNRAVSLNPRNDRVLRNLGIVHVHLANKAARAGKPFRQLLLKARDYFGRSLHYNPAQEGAAAGLAEVDSLLKVATP